MKKIISLLPILGIISLWGSIVVANFSANTWLSGWDNLHPEFNLQLNINRSLSVLWQEYQGLGLLGGMAHAADFPRQLVLLSLSSFVPLYFLRYIWVFAMLLIGPIGVSCLSSLLFSKWVKKQENNIAISAASFIASAFYLLNLATVQSFFNPYETFIAFYGFLPWLLYSSLRYLVNPKKANALLLAFIVFFAAPAFYVQTLFVVFALILSVFCLEFLIREGKRAIKAIIQMGVIIFTFSAYWLLPPLYFTLSSPTVVSQAKTSYLSTYETQLMNEGFATVKDISLLRGYWFEYTDLGKDGSFDYLYAPWRDYVTKPGVAEVGMALFVGAALGLVFGALKRKTSFGPSVFFVFLLSSCMLLGGAYKLPFLAQIFRSVYTKWAEVSALTYSLGLGFLFLSLSTLASKFRFLKRILSGLVFLGLLIAMVFITRPVFSGKLISTSMKVQVPTAYQELFGFFNNQAASQKRIAFFPVQTYWGWNFNDWGYRGSGFLWYGIKQPILDRAFDGWSEKNEGYYHEISRAVYAKDQESFKQVLDKYDVGFALIDRSVIVPQVDSELLRINDIVQALENMGAQKIWAKDFLEVYELPGSPASFVFAPTSIFETDSETSGVRQDIIFAKERNYITKNAKVAFPFSDLTQERVKNISYKSPLADTTSIDLASDVSLGTNSKLVIPALSDMYDASAYVSLNKGQLVIEFIDPVSIKADGKKIELPTLLPPLYLELAKRYTHIFVSIGGVVVEVDEGGRVLVNSIPVETSKPLEVAIFDSGSLKKQAVKEQFLQASINKCWTRDGSEGLIDSHIANDELVLTMRDAVGCSSFMIGNFGSAKTLLEVALPFKSPNGARPHFCVLKAGTETCLNDDIFYHSDTSKVFSSVSRTLVLDANTSYWMVISGRPPDEAGKQWQITYKAPEIKTYSEIAHLSFSPAIFDELTREHTVPLPSETKALTVSLPSESKELHFDTRGRLEVTNCDIFKRGETKKDGLVYSALGRGAACDFVIAESAVSDHDYLLRLIGENTQGRSMKLYLYNQASKRNDLEDLLPKGAFDSTYSILKWQNLASLEYILNIETRSLGGELTENALKKVAFYPVPITWLTTWIVTGDQNEKINNPVSVNKVTKRGTFFYSVDVKASTKGIIALSQGYDKGWIAISEGKILPHYQFNTWANAWEVQQGEHTVVIFYWPQLLQYGGFVLLIGGLIHFVISSVRDGFSIYQKTKKFFRRK